MSQFDVYINPSRTTRKAFPYIVDIQSPVISEITTRIVIPLGKLEHFKNKTMAGLTPEIQYEKKTFLLLVPQISSVPSNILKNPIGSISHLRNEIISALNFAITGI